MNPGCSGSRQSTTGREPDISNVADLGTQHFAQEKLEQANKEVQNVSADLESLKLLRSAEAGQEVTAPQNCLARLQAGMTQVCEEMAQGAIDQCEMAQTQEQMRQLFQRLTRLAQAAHSRSMQQDIGQQAGQVIAGQAPPQQLQPPQPTGLQQPLVHGGQQLQMLQPVQQHQLQPTQLGFAIRRGKCSRALAQ